MLIPIRVLKYHTLPVSLPILDCGMGVGYVTGRSSPNKFVK